ncbi:MAG: adenylate/guanylate cyclase domain-containing protein [Candidatus Riflebacteria bacterium]|nr:adenylate/guanylate cyclase domain-containing protein [Candidatus Riflebacteria bacterium]
MPEISENENRFQEVLKNDSNQALHLGSVYAAWFGLVGGLLLFVNHFAGLPGNFVIPGIWAFFCGLYSLMIARFSGQGLSSRTQLFCVVGYVSLPSIIYIIAHFQLPMGAATYLTGPPSYLYLFLIILSGFMFSEKVALVAGIAAGIQYFLVYLLGRSHFSMVNCPDQLFMIDLTGGLFYFFKSMMMVFTGFAISILARKHKEQITRILEEENSRQHLDRVFGQYVSPEIKARILQLREGAPGEKREVTVLFSDIRSFTTLCEHLPAENVVGWLNSYFERMGPCINQHGGVIDKYIGDAIMATFGAAAELPNSCHSAVAAAFAMREELRILNTEMKTKGLPEVAIGIGLHYGDVIMGTIGSKKRREFTVIGDTVNTASRIETACKAYQTSLIITESVYQKLPESDSQKFFPLGLADLKGKSEKVPIFGIKPAA